MSLMTIADLENLAANHSQTITTVPTPKWQPPQLTKRDVRQRVFGTLKLLVFLCGGDMRQEVDAADFLVRRIDELERQAEEREAAHQREIEAIRNSKTEEIAGYKKALRNIAARLDIYRDPFDNKPFSKWKNDEKGRWMLAAGETIDWAVQRADNQLDPINAITIAADED